ncbi:MAG TPA: tetratricopeptide repeat protein [Fimbriimonas sp.]|nr:tetratricopeptide repeat protein [Fimbriimonas sp.]
MFEEAKAELQRLLAKDPANIDAAHQLALIQGFEGDIEGSIEALIKLTLQAPDHLEIRYDLAMAQMMLGKFDEARANLRHILAIEPTHEKALQQLAYC